MNTVAAKLTAARDSTRTPAGETRRVRWPLLWTVVVAALLGWGSQAHLERYITPRGGLGYAMGIAGGSMMLLLLLYSARKRFAWLRWMGALPAWFQFHMVLGVVGPVLILFHSNFRLGATNSNVALVSMLLVAGSGVVGRYIYTRLHARLDGHEDTLEQLKAVGERLGSQSTSIALLPGLLETIEAVEKRWIAAPRGGLARLAHLPTGALRMARARQLVRRAIKAAVEQALRSGSPTLEQHAPRIAQAARSYAYRRLEAGRRIGEYQMYSQLFSLWHVLHIPLFFILLIAGLVHVVAINVY